jgi:hypothetical protein
MARGWPLPGLRALTFRVTGSGKGKVPNVGSIDFAGRTRQINFPRKNFP